MAERITVEEGNRENGKFCLESLQRLFVLTLTQETQDRVTTDDKSERKSSPDEGAQISFFIQILWI